jgi:uncharacterized protein YlzI (FlbEa/FlbD family)
MTTLVVLKYRDSKGEPVHVNPLHVETIRAASTGTDVSLASGGHLFVEGAPEQVAAEVQRALSPAYAQYVAATDELHEFTKVAWDFAEFGMDLTELPCHGGLTTPEACGRCGKVLKLRERIEKIMTRDRGVR